ncbi:50S ribosomal protein L7/L12 [Candidatus Mycoplasma haematominutum]|uniref:Large ribosomal subunit protein bL12 n=1 Tax=Candidatus Mycoplasma haematominutum 'Birmingham 1' TaxID=1116213 RepID=G8C312_9MOLU|nr:50S ribosomal protein L7/L12 [Candidatus Mycoplasma haematominutum]CCE66710.1 ribosomal protein L7/L12 [Candidatus Mycoplasma haematominutum 'Birmingham 1']
MSTKLNSKEIIASLKEFSVVELNELVRELETEFNVSATSFAAPTSGEKKEEEGEKVDANKDLYLTAAGTNKIGVIKLVRELTSLGLMEAKKIVDSAPSLVKADIPSSQFEELKSKFEAIGATVEFKPASK